MKKTLPYIIAAVVVAAILFLLFYKNPRVFDTRITLNRTEKIPYGTFVAYQFLKKQFPKGEIVTNKKSPKDWEILSYDSSEAKQVLLIVNSYFNPDETELDDLTSFAQKGNYVFISALQMNDLACEYFKVTQESIYNINFQQQGSLKKFDSFAVSLDTAIFPRPVNFAYPGISYDNHFEEIDSSFSFPLGYTSKHKPNLLAIETEKGAIFLHSAPIAFTNFFILYSNNHQYYEKLMSLLPEDAHKVVWDEYFLYKRTDENDGGKSLLSVMLQYQNFKWAFWLVISLLCIYLITEIKRKQRIIPSFNKPLNDSVEFVTTVGKLYFEKGDHKNLAEKLTTFFLDHVRNIYKIPTSEINSFFAAKLSAKVNVPLEVVNEIINNIHTIQLNDKITAKQLLHYYELLENFYKKA